MKSEYKVTSYHPETTEEEKEEIYEQIAKVFIRMAQKDLKRNENKQKRWKQMKRSWKNFRIDKSKVYMRLGQAVAYTSMWLAGVAFCYWMFLQGMTY